MLMPNLGWSTDQAWTYILPIADPSYSYCTVMKTEILNIREDGTNVSGED